MDDPDRNNFVYEKMDRPQGGFCVLEYRDELLTQQFISGFKRNRQWVEQVNQTRTLQLKINRKQKSKYRSHSNLGVVVEQFKSIRRMA